jgi:nitrile hydratase accessory protein
MRISSSASTHGRAILSRPEDVFTATAAVAPIPVCADGPVFTAPWEAQAFAMTLRLHERGVFTWSEWADALAASIRNAQAAGDPDDGTTYYAHWLAALEAIIASKGVTDGAALEDRRAAFDRAAKATPHGEPVLLKNDPLARS